MATPSISSHFRRQTGLTVDVTVSATETSASFAASVCPKLNATVTTFRVNNNVKTLVELPSCLQTAGSAISTLISPYVVVEDVRNMPSALRIWTCQSCYFGPVSTSPASAASPSSPNPPPTSPNSTPNPSPSSVGTGFDDVGDIIWDDLFGSTPLLDRVDFTLSHLSGTLPESMPGRMQKFWLRECNIYGTIPSSLLTAVGSSTTPLFDFDFTGNEISGAIPSGLFDQLENKTSMFGASALSFASNSLSSSIPTGFLEKLSPLTTLSKLKLSLENNGLSGTLPADLIPILSGSLELNLRNNSLSGTVPPTLFSNVVNNTVHTINFGHNKLEGPLPSALFPPGWQPDSFDLDLSSNLISGTIPDGLFSSGFITNVTMEFINLQLQNNRLSGTIPETLLFNYDSANSPVAWQAISNLALDLTNNRLEGTIPENLLAPTLSVATQGAPAFILLGSNKLSGTIPRSLLYQATSGSTFAFNVADNQFVGELPGCPVSEYMFSFNFSNNNFNGSIPAEWQRCKFFSLDLGSNVGIEGTIPSWLFSSPTFLAFVAKNTSISGTIPATGALTSIVLSDTLIDFCDANSVSAINNSSFYDCAVSACSCSNLYPDCNLVCPPPPTPPPTSPPAPTSCPSLQSPTNLPLVCKGGFWTLPAEVHTSPLFVAPKGVGTLIVEGDFGGQAIHFNDLGSSIEIEGCATSLESVDVEISPSEVRNFGQGKITQTLVAVTNTSCTNLKGVKLTSSVSGGGCKKLSSEKKVSSNGQTLSGVFSINSSSCNTWWIILVAVMSSAVVLAVVITVIVVVIVPKAKVTFRPYAGSDGRMTF